MSLLNELHHHLEEQKEKISAVIRFPVNSTFGMSARFKNKAQPLKNTNR